MFGQRWRRGSGEGETPSRQNRTTTGSFWRFLSFCREYAYRRGYVLFSYVELLKDLVVGILYKRRGKFARPFLYTALMSIFFVGITFGPLLVQRATAEELAAPAIPSAVIRTSTGDTAFVTELSEEVVKFRGGEVIEHVVQPDETVASIAQKYNLQPNTILMENNLTAQSKLKPGQRLRVLPMDGVRHKVQRGETIFTIAKKYALGDDEVAAQPIISFPFNTFADDNTFSLTAGQYVFVPGGVRREVTPFAAVRVTTPNAGAVSATGAFVWPAAGYLSQGYFWYHKGWDIANRGGGKILAADAGKIIVSGWVDNTGYGNRVMIDHGNGTITLYGHLSVVRVQVGQTVNKGDVIGDMGSTGRSTGTHLHFEVRVGGQLLNPGGYLR